MLSDRARGFVYGIVGVVIVSPDALLCRLPSPDEDYLLITACRCMWICLFCTLTSITKSGGVRILLRQARAHIRPLLLIAGCSTVTSLGFPISLQLTGSAEALLLISLNPLWGALIGWRFLGDVLPLRTKIALAGAILSIGLIFSPRVISGAAEHTSPRPNRLAGDLIAIGTGVGLGGFGNAVRFCRQRHRELPTQVGQILSNAAAASVCMLTMAATSRPFVIREPGRFWGTTCLMGVVINAAYLFFNVAPK